MLKLRPDQMTLSIRKEADFIRWYVSDYMPENLADIHQTYTTEELDILIKSGRDQSIQNGFNDPHCQSHFITLMWHIGANFYETPAFKSILENNKLSETERIDQFYQVSDEDWEKSMQQTNEQYWLKDKI